MDTRSKGKINYLADPTLMMDAKDTKASSSRPQASTRHGEHGEDGGNPGENSTHILREIREGNQKLAAQLDSKLTEINNVVTNLNKTMSGLVTRVTQAENQ